MSATTLVFFKGVENITSSVFLDSFIGFYEATKVKINKVDAIQSITHCRKFEVALICCTIVDHIHLNFQKVSNVLWFTLEFRFLKSTQF